MHQLRVSNIRSILQKYKKLCSLGLDPAYECAVHFLSELLLIVFKLQTWIDGIRIHGLREIRRRPGFHDEPLKSNRKGQRSIRLNKAYRAIYITDENNNLHFIEVIEVNKHEY